MDSKSGKNDSLTVQNSSDSFSNYSTALSVTIAIGCSLLVSILHSVFFFVIDPKIKIS